MQTVFIWVGGFGGGSSLHEISRYHIEFLCKFSNQNETSIEIAPSLQREVQSWLSSCHWLSGMLESKALGSKFWYREYLETEMSTSRMTLSRKHWDVVGHLQGSKAFSLENSERKSEKGLPGPLGPRVNIPPKKSKTSRKRAKNPIKTWKIVIIDSFSSLFDPWASPFQIFVWVCQGKAFWLL